MKPEKILCSHTSDLPPDWLGDSVSIPVSEEVFFSTLESISPVWMNRAQAEEDENFKQWIPYVLLTNPQGLYAVYPRKGSETRLHGSWSAGLGGHVNTDDQSPAGNQWAHLLYSGLKRELREEFPSAIEGNTFFLGVINENQSPVGRVHIGAVFLHITTGACDRAGLEIEGFTWLPPDQFGSSDWPFERFELWSRLAFKLIPNKSIL